MSIEVTCNGCGATLRVADHHAGRSAKCPQCENVFRVPAQAGPTPTPPTPPTTPPATPPNPSPTIGQSNKWMVRTPDGQIYGPAFESDINQWIAENRVTPACQACREGESNWQPASVIFSRLGGVGAAPTANPFAEAPYQHPPQTSAPNQYSKEHRGGLILTLGILSVACCGFFGPAAWIMAHGDMKEMDAQVMDPSGRGMTQAGMIIGIIGTVLLVFQMGFGGLAVIAEM